MSLPELPPFLASEEAIRRYIRENARRDPVLRSFSRRFGEIGGRERAARQMLAEARRRSDNFAIIRTSRDLELIRLDFDVLYEEYAAYLQTIPGPPPPPPPAKIVHLQRARQYYAIIRKAARTPDDFFAELRVFLWTKSTKDDPLAEDRYPDSELEIMLNTIVQRYFSNIQNNLNIHVRDVDELKVRDLVDQDEAEAPLDSIRFSIIFRQNISGRITETEYAGRMQHRIIQGEAMYAIFEEA